MQKVLSAVFIFFSLFLMSCINSPTEQNKAPKYENIFANVPTEQRPKQ